MTKVLVSIEEGLLARIDREAAARGVSRSAYLVYLAKRELGLLRGPGQAEPVRNALRRLDDLFVSQPRAEEVTLAVRRSRDER